MSRYDRHLLRTIVTFGYVGWAAFSASLLLFQETATTSISDTNSAAAQSFITSFFIGILLSFWTLFALQGDPLTYYAYIAFPCYFWNDVVGKVWSVWISERGTRRFAGPDIWKTVGLVIVAVATTQIMAVS